MAGLFEPLSLAHGPAWKNRFMLAPLTNQQSHADGRLSDDEHRWLVKRATGGFGLTMTAAAHVQAVGQGFAGQLGIFDDAQLDGLTRLAAAIRAEGSVSSVQLHHAGNRSPAELVGTPVCPSDDPETGARGLTLDEVRRLRDDFIVAATRAESAGFDGVEVHGAHGYILTQFLSADTNRRDDIYGGDLDNRARLLVEIVDGIRSACRADFQIGLRLSPERFGLKLGEIRDVAGIFLRAAAVDYLDLSLWDVTKEAVEEEYQGRPLLDWFTDLPRGNVKLGAAGKIMSGADARAVIAAGCDFAVIGRGAILRHDFPARVRADPDYVSPPLPVTAQHLADEGLGTAFIGYMSGWPGFVATDDAD
ncbi:NADH:flavin oxidoreductase [Sphingomonas sp. Leaf412]|uniref:NADH:flavin oxidoreductase n=1 Tax=Sphingomonas sp. Leaf412 TaxID=1736370 RepID=UPI000701D206|nr:NADH:flavin oxidoreductase [Sphingomonas sp. Leaf412]KQT35332.1 NADH:flavin oxidoreductase [Sphingomonas sp. Leaf412]